MSYELSLLEALGIKSQTYWVSKTKSFYMFSSDKS